ncbi:hypothetical protein F441_22417, partial [Phytophthora nicotianae CJ01A1]
VSSAEQKFYVVRLIKSHACDNGCIVQKLVNTKDGYLSPGEPGRYKGTGRSDRPSGQWTCEDLDSGANRTSYQQTFKREEKRFLAFNFSVKLTSSG